MPISFKHADAIVVSSFEEKAEDLLPYKSGVTREKNVNFLLFVWR
jgi:hypothetical protein